MRGFGPRERRHSAGRGRWSRGGLSSLTELYGFRFGIAVSYDQLKKRRYRRLILRNCSHITPINDMKAGALLDHAATRQASDGMPVMNYQKADRIVAWARRHGISVRGHTLVYHAYMPHWFFRERYDMEAAPASREVILQRMECYIDRVIRHFEEKFPGTVSRWDVANEALGDNEQQYDADDPLEIRTVYEGDPNPWMTYVGREYIACAYRFAHETIRSLSADIRLCYNDYSTFYKRKTARVLRLAESLALQENGETVQLIDSIGMEGYIGGYGSQNGCMKRSNIDQIREAVQTFAKQGYEVEMTELTVRNFEKDKEHDHALFCGELFRMFRKLGAGGENPLKAVTVWGLTDVPETAPEALYNLNPYGGLFDTELRPKEAFFRIREALLGGEL